MKIIFVFIGIVIAFSLIYFGTFERNVNYLALTITFFLLLGLSGVLLFRIAKNYDEVSCGNPLFFIVKSLLFYFGLYQILLIGVAEGGHTVLLWVVKILTGVILLFFPLLIWQKGREKR